MSEGWNRNPARLLCIRILGPQPDRASSETMGRKLREPKLKRALRVVEVKSKEIIAKPGRGRVSSGEWHVV